MTAKGTRKPSKRSKSSFDGGGYVRLHIGSKPLGQRHTLIIKPADGSRTPVWIDELLANHAAKFGKLRSAVASCELVLAGNLASATRMPVELERWVTDILQAVVTNRGELLPQSAHNPHLGLVCAVHLTERNARARKVAVRNLDQLAAEALAAGKALSAADVGQLSNTQLARLVDIVQRTSGEFQAELQQLIDAQLKACSVDVRATAEELRLPPRPIAIDATTILSTVTNATTFIEFVEQALCEQRSGKRAKTSAGLQPQIALVLSDHVAAHWPQIRTEVDNGGQELKQRFRKALSAMLDRCGKAIKCPVCARPARLQYWRPRNQLKLVHPDRSVHHNQKELPTTIEYVAAHLRSQNSEEAE